MTDTTHTLDDLVRATGFSKRQIRFYITRRLVPGAGDSRGPNAAYGEDTLQRLRALAILKDKRIEPTGRRLTLDEIGHALDTLGGDGVETLVAGRAELTILDTDEPRGLEPAGSASEYVAGMREDFLLEGPPKPGAQGFAAHQPEARITGGDLLHHMKAPTRIGGEDEEDEEDDIGDTLGHLQALLAELGSDTRFIAADGTTPWQRITTPDLEFHVRQPDNHAARLRLATMARTLARLLEREDDQ